MMQKHLTLTFNKVSFTFLLNFERLTLKFSHSTSQFDIYQDDQLLGK